MSSFKSSCKHQNISTMERSRCGGTHLYQSIQETLGRELWVRDQPGYIVRTVSKKTRAGGWWSAWLARLYVESPALKKRIKKKTIRFYMVSFSLSLCMCVCLYIYGCIQFLLHIYIYIYIYKGSEPEAHWGRDIHRIKKSLFGPKGKPMNFNG
jgi:hypothetical protein